jgi:hypothetical protein
VRKLKDFGEGMQGGGGPDVFLKRGHGLRRQGLEKRAECLPTHTPTPLDKRADGVGTLTATLRGSLAGDVSAL